jgi:hypothetical protein
VATAAGVTVAPLVVVEMAISTAVAAHPEQRVRRGWG